MKLMKRLIKQSMYVLMPRYSTAFFPTRARAHAHGIYRQWGCEEILKSIIQHHGSKVLAGPFQGLELIPSTFLEHSSPYLLGTYERELHQAWETVFQGNYEQILDVGAKFGFYAIGLALRFPNAPVVAFDTDRWARETTMEMAEANHAGPNLTVESFCDKSWLRKKLLPNALIVSDCEGYEAILFDSPNADSLRSATLIIETHDHEVPGVTTALIRELSQTHQVVEIRSQEGATDCSVNLSFLEPDEQRLALNDMRPGQSWLLALPQNGTNANLSRSG